MTREEYRKTAHEALDLALDFGEVQAEHDVDRVYNMHIDVCSRSQRIDVWMHDKYSHTENTVIRQSNQCDLEDIKKWLQEAIADIKKDLPSGNPGEEA